VLAVDGISPLQKEFNADPYVLAVPISLSGEPGLREKAAAEFHIPSTNRDPAKLTTLLLTGVTAMVRATAWLMEKKGILYPAQDIGPLLRAADLTHISNEVPFAPDCPFPDPSPGIYRFCSDSRYIDLMEYIGTDIVELTGNHFQDWGSEATLFTLELYRQRGWKTYGGGANLEDAKKSITVEHNGNRLAFIGCNIHGPDFAWATPSLPGSAPCDFEFLRSEIRRLRDAGYLPIMTYQYHEYEYYEPTEPQMQDFRDVADAGAIIVSGSQGHHPQGFEFRNRAFLHYGLGNLFFDQFYFGEEYREAFIDRHVFYDGRYLGAELITIVFVDNARSRLMEPSERAVFLEKVFSSTRWSFIE
jgi:poly-gamma-glutamate synthesis protein (capsule biosynthesis protein)